MQVRIVRVFVLGIAFFGSVAFGQSTQGLALNQLKNAAYSGFEDLDGEVVLRDGSWEGEPPVPGSASVPRVDFLGDLSVLGDLDGDGRDEAAVILTTQFGGTGVFHYLAIMAERRAGVRNVATRLVGDRILVRDLRVETGRVLLDLVRPGPDDAACCPTEVATLEYRLQGDELSEPAQIGASTRLTPDVLADEVWRLAAWGIGEPAKEAVSLAYADGKFTGHAGCNTYSTKVSATDERGTIEVGQAAATRKLCSPDIMSGEQRFLALLPRVNRFWFHAGQLALAYETGRESGALFLDREQ